MHTKIQNDQNFGKISCTDPLYLQLKTPPILMSILFCIITCRISSNISNYQKSMNICEFKNQFEKNEAMRVQRRVRTLQVLQYCVLTFFSVNLSLFVWDLTKYQLTSWKEPVEVNCYNVFQNRILNDSVQFLSHFFQTQVEMIIVVVVFWKRFKQSHNFYGPHNAQMRDSLIYPFADFKLN